MTILRGDPVMLRRIGPCAFVLPLVLTLLPAAAGAQGMSDVTIETIPLGSGVAMLTGAGGNLAVSAGRDGAFLVDTQFAPLTGKIQAAVSQLSKIPVRLVVDTHWHRDHVGGNENFAKAGAVLIAHENVRRRMASGGTIAALQAEIPPASAAALPQVTFSDSLDLHWNDEEIRVVHVPSAHTDGDAVVWFVKADVMHVGDIYFNGLYPFVDLSSGGSVSGLIAAADRVLALAGENTKIIPGHGPLSNPREFRAYRDLVATVYGRVRELVAQGKSKDEVLAARPSAEYDALWGNDFMSPTEFVGILYDDASRER
jgi:glyoxylase-like metal-dependent hydrolase (beta-lactamase superfamily II)